MSVLSLSYYESDITVTTNKYLSELTSHHGWKRAGMAYYGMKKLRHYHPMYSKYIKRTCNSEMKQNIIKAISYEIHNTKYKKHYMEHITINWKLINAINLRNQTT